MDLNKSKERSSELATAKKKRARGANIATSTSDLSTASTLLASIDVRKRAKKLSKKLSSLYKKFPEMEFILASEKLQADVVKTAVQQYKDTMLQEVQLVEANEAKKRKVEKEESVPLYSLPDEVLQNCISFVGKGHYGVLGLVSKKLHRIYTNEYRRITNYVAVATSVNVVNYFLDNLCKYPEERKNILKAAAVNGNLDVLRSLVKDGYDLSLLVEIKKCTIYNADGNYFDEDDLEFGFDDCNEEDWEQYAIDFYYTDECDYRPSYTIKLSQIVSRGHLHVLKYLHEELNYKWGLQRYCKPAIKYGQLEILKWLHDIGCMEEDDDLHELYYDTNKREYKSFSFQNYAFKCVNLESFEWLSNNGFAPYPRLSDAIRTNSLEMIRYCFGREGICFQFKGTMNEWISRNCASNIDIIKFLRSISIPWDNVIMTELVEHGTVEMIQYVREDGCPWTTRGDECKFRNAIKASENMEVYRLVHELGFEFKGTMKEWICCSYRIAEYFDIMKFLRSISIPWDNEIMKYIVQYGTVAMIQCAREDGCPWTSRRDEYNCLYYDNGWVIDKFKYLIRNGCKFDYEKFNNCNIQSLMKLLCKQKEVALLELVVGKNTSFDQQLSKYCYGEHWNEGVSYIVQNGK
ncbi:hypothetical protein CTEN210_12003 [Chaetoceros tenuissimus]|uniref:F-box domain-containing protein n=1 Tax=Chaetoceros tenuissimus TaxID=426638 RepID=A0AAD3D0D3_9STRA|nr:hypothetical protein CTEN210_12003 [Chaetoceros tenuissimus]